jgi:hypothetical protein
LLGLDRAGQGNCSPIHNILSPVHQLTLSQTALGTLPEEDVNVMPTHVGATIHN